MNKNSIAQFLVNLGGTISASQNRKGYVLSTCPLAPYTHESGVDNHPSFAVSVKERGESRYNCFSCQNHGSLSDLVFKLKRFDPTNEAGYKFKDSLQLIAQELDDIQVGNLPDFEDHVVDPDKIVYFPEETLETYKRAVHVPLAMEYLTGRGLSESTVDFFDLRYDTHKHTVCFPIRDTSGKLCGFHGRYINPPPESSKYHAYKWKAKVNKIVWLGEQWVDPELPVVLVESVFDLAAVYPVYPNVMCSLSAGIGAGKLKRIKAFLEVFTFYDNDKGGDMAREAITKHLEYSAIVDLYPPKGKDPGDMSKEDIKSLLHQHGVL